MRVRKIDVPYMTKEWKDAIRKKRKFAKKFAKNQTEENRFTKNKWRNIATKCRRKAIKDYWKRKTDDFNIKPAAFYKTFKPFLDDKSKVTMDKCIALEKNGNILRDLSKVADCFLEYFSSVANCIGDPKILDLNEDELKSHTSVQRINDNSKVVNSPPFQIKSLHCEEVTKALKDLNVRKGMGHDRLPNLILRLGCEELAPSLTTLYNNCIVSCYWPSQWKMGEWIPVYKKDSIYEEKYYRPVTLLPVCDKVFEKLLSQQVSAFMETRLSKNLTAYRKRHSTETTLIKIA